MINAEALAMRDEIAKELYLHLVKEKPALTTAALKYLAEYSLGAAEVFMHAKYVSDKKLVRQSTTNRETERNSISANG